MTPSANVANLVLMATPADLQPVDSAIAAALQVNGRASWGAVARALEVPERTVARRGQRLLDMGLVRVSTYLDTTIVRHARPLVIELKTALGKTLSVARALGARRRLLRLRAGRLRRGGVHAASPNAGGHHVAPVADIPALLTSPIDA
jgi:DNA-binding Lrp family transcriptional regulator